MQDMEQISQMFKDLGLSEMTVKDGDFEISLKKAEPENEVVKTSDVSTASSAREVPESQKTENAVEEEIPGAKVTAPLPGIFCGSESEGAEPYVKVGDHVDPDTVVCAIEAMKMFNTVKAGVTGKVSRVCVESGDMVEFGQTLFVIEEETA